MPGSGAQREVSALPEGAHGVAEVEGSRQEHRSTTTQDDRDPGPAGLVGHSPGKGGEVEERDGSRDAGLKLRAMRGRAGEKLDYGMIGVEGCRVGSPWCSMGSDWEYFWGREGEH